MPLSADEQKEYEQLEYEKLLAEKNASMASPKVIEQAAPPAPTEGGNDIPRTISGVLSIPGKIADKMAVDAAELKKMGWENLSPRQRLDLMLYSLPGAAADVVMGGSRKVEGMAERAVPVALGQFAGRATRIPGADRLGGAVGGATGEVIAEMREGGSVSPGRVTSAALSGLVRGKPLAGAGSSDVAKEAVKYATVGVGGKVAETTIDEGRLPTAGEAVTAAGTSAIGAPAAKLFSKAGVSPTGRPAMYDMEMETLRDLRKEGVVIPPHEIGAGSDTLSSFGGKAALQQEAAKRNQFVWQKLAREEIGLSKEALPIRKSELNDIRTEAAAPYREIQTIQREAKQHLEDRLSVIAKESDPHAAMIKMEEPAMKESLSILNTLAAADVDALKEARFSMQRAKKAFFSGDPNAYEPWQKAKAEAGRLEDAIDRAAASLKDESLLSRLKASRERIAKTYDVEDSLNLGNGFVEPLSFGRQLANGERLTGNLEKIAKFQLAFRREAVEAGRVPTPGVGNIGAMASTGMASRGDAPGLIGAAANMTIGRAARPFLLSDFFQNSMMNPAERQNFAAVMARYVADRAAEDAAERREGQPASP